MITDAWVRVQERPERKLSCGVAFDEFEPGAEAVREISQAGLYPANCRLLDAVEAETTGAGPAGKALLVLGFESAAPSRRRRRWRSRSRPPARMEESPARSGAAAAKSEGEGDSVGAWRNAFLQRALPARRDGRLRRPLRHLRDGDHLGPVPGASTPR